MSAFAYLTPELIGVTRERVRQLRDRALKRLREGDVGRALGSFAA